VFNSPSLVSLLKLMALEDMLGHSWRGRVVLASADAPLVAAFRCWCGNAGFELEVRHVPAAAPPMTRAQRVRRWLPQPVQALATLLLHVKRSGKLRGAGVAGLERTTARTTFCSYLFNLDAGAAKAGRFSSYFWTGLHAVLEREVAGVNWLLMSVDHELVPNAARARELVDEFNRHGDNAGIYAAVDGLLDWRVALRALRDWLRVSLTSVGVRAARGGFRLPQSNVDAWPLLKTDWRSSLRGSMAMTNCIFLNLFESALGRLPRQRLGVYLLENIGWEMAFLHCWKAAGHGQVVGVAHSTVRFWDLRYFFDPRHYPRTGRNDLPLPDAVAVNGPAPLEIYRRGGFPADRLVEVEALRYLHLADAPRAAANRRESGAGPLRVLVLGDYTPEATRTLMSWLAVAAGSLPGEVAFVVKPHPACPIDAADYPSLTMRLTNRPLGELLPDCDVAYTSNTTSASVDAHSLGVPVITVRDGKALNISPLRGVSGVTFVGNAAELASALGRAREATQAVVEPYFCLDRSLPRWRQLLGLSATTS
jgi:surface carbohydrate biosynthesis protein (TIGR04326 family)